MVQWKGSSWNVRVRRLLILDDMVLVYIMNKCSILEHIILACISMSETFCGTAERVFLACKGMSETYCGSVEGVFLA